MNKVIEADFLPGNTDIAFSWLDSIGHSTQRRILIVDNDKNMTHLIKILLEKTGRYVVFEENDSTKTQQTARSFRPDLIFFDIDTPDRHAREIAAQIGDDFELQYTPIVFLTAVAMPDDPSTGFQIDKHPFLAKPIDLQELINAIEAHVPAHPQDRGYDKRA